MATFTRDPSVTVDPSLLSATVSWQTDVDTYGEILYGPDPVAMTSVADDLNLGTVHSLVLSPLTAQTTYYYSVKLVDPSGNPLIDSGQLSFRTVALVPAITQGPVADPSIDSADVSWTANVEGAGLVMLGSDPANLSQNYPDPTVSGDHSITCQGLTPGTTYQYRVSNIDPGTGQVLIQSNLTSFVTPALPAPGGVLKRPQAQPRRVRKNQNSVLTVRLNKTGGLIPFPDQTVGFEILAGSVPAAFDQTSSKATGRTNATGQARAVLTAGNQRGLIRVKITSEAATNVVYLHLMVRRV